MSQSGSWTSSYEIATSFVSKCLNLYNPLLGGVTKARNGRIPPKEDLNPNCASLLSEAPKINVDLLRGLQVNWVSPLAERLTRTHSWKFCGKGNPMMGIPSNSFESTVQWQGGDMTNKGPAWQCIFGPFSLSQVVKGNFHLQSQVVNVSDNSQHVLVNDWDINAWNMFLMINQWTPKYKDYHFKVKSTLQVQGGLSNMFSGQSAMEGELSYRIGRIKKFDTTLGMNVKTQIPAFNELHKLPLAILGANPYVIFKRHNTVFEDDKNLNSDNQVSISYEAKRISFEVASVPTIFQDPLMEMSIKNPEFMKTVPKDAREEHFQNWVKSEKNQYLVKGNFDLTSKMFDYSLAAGTKFINTKSDLTLELKSLPGHLVPTIFGVSLSENMVLNNEGPTPLTTQITMRYDAAKPENPPEIGLGFNIEL